MVMLQLVRFDRVAIRVATCGLGMIPTDIVYKHVKLASVKIQKIDCSLNVYTEQGHKNTKFKKHTCRENYNG